jgi:signal peptidase II
MGYAAAAGSASDLQGMRFALRGGGKGVSCGIPTAARVCTEASKGNMDSTDPTAKPSGSSATAEPRSATEESVSAAESMVDTQASHSEATADAAVRDGAATADEPTATPVTVAEPEVRLIAPGVERLLAPMLTAKRAPEPIKGGPSAVFLFVVAGVSLVLDLGTKRWAEQNLNGDLGRVQPVDAIDGHLSFVLAKNPGGAWGLLQSQSENLRRPFFLLVSIAAIMFIVTLYKRLHPSQHALRWGLPLVLGGALGNVYDRVKAGVVTDFIDYHADWVRTMNEFVKKYVKGHMVTDHWPTFNIADVAICIGVGLMAVDMFTSRKAQRGSTGAPALLTPLGVQALGLDNEPTIAPHPASPGPVSASTASASAASASAASPGTDA